MHTSGDLVVIFNTGFSAVVDGPGQRMVIYLKGCNLRCPWCAAPESISFTPQVLFYTERIKNPDTAINACPYKSLSFAHEIWNRDINICNKCLKHECVKTCNPAFELVGQTVCIDSLVDRAKHYRPFYGKSGGVTIGGGEPTCQFDSLKVLLEDLKGCGIHTAIETNGTHPELPSLYDLIDLLYIDFKHPDPASYHGGLGDNVLENIGKRYSHGKQMIVRIPLVSGYNTDTDTIHLFGRMLSSVGAVNVHVLPYHTRGYVKWQACGMPYSSLPLRVPTRKEAEGVITILCSYNLNASE